MLRRLSGQYVVGLPLTAADITALAGQSGSNLPPSPRLFPGGQYPARPPIAIPISATVAKGQKLVYHRPVGRRLPHLEILGR
jgi:hypothetical protein